MELRNITGVITKGGLEGWVTSFKIIFSKNRFVWNNILSSEGVPRIFIGNYDKDTPKTNYFLYPIQTQYLRIVPVKWESNINMRIEPLGCFIPYRKLQN